MYIKGGASITPPPQTQSVASAILELPLPKSTRKMVTAGRKPAPKTTSVVVFKGNRKAKPKPQLTRKNAMAAIEMVAEKKAVDTTIALTCDDLTTRFTVVGGIAQGSAPYNRNGRSVKITALHFRGYFASASVTIPVLIRVFAFVVPGGPQITSSALDTTQIYSGVNGAGAAISTITAGRNLAFSENVKVIAMEEFYMSVPANGSIDATNKKVEFFVNNLNFKQNYNGTATSDGSANNIWIGVWSNNPTASPNQYVLNGTCRVKFIDA